MQCLLSNNMDKEDCDTKIMENIMERQQFLISTDVNMFKVGVGKDQR